MAAFFPHGTISNPAAITTDPAAAKASAANPGDWGVLRPQCRRHALCAVGEITPANVNQLQVAWTYTGRRTVSEPGVAAGVDENTPLQIGTSLYSCTPENLVTAIDADTGKAIWKFDPTPPST